MILSCLQIILQSRNSLLTDVKTVAQQKTIYLSTHFKLLQLAIKDLK